MPANTFNRVCTSAGADGARACPVDCILILHPPRMRYRPPKTRRVCTADYAASSGCLYFVGTLRACPPYGRTYPVKVFADILGGCHILTIVGTQPLLMWHAGELRDNIVIIFNTRYFDIFIPNFCIFAIKALNTENVRRISEYRSTRTTPSVLQSARRSETPPQRHVPDVVSRLCLIRNT